MESFFKFHESKIVFKSNCYRILLSFAVCFFNGAVGCALGALYVALLSFRSAVTERDAAYVLAEITWEKKDL